MDEEPECQLHDVEHIFEKFMKMAMQRNHYGKDPACPTCQAVIEGIAYCKKYHSPEKLIEKYGKEAEDAIEEVRKNPRKYLFT